MPEKQFGTKLTPHRPVAIGIDQSLTGFAVTAVCIDAPEEYVTWVYKSDRRGVSRLADIQWWLESKFDLLDTQSNRITEIAMEGTVVASHSASILGELAGVVKLTCWHYFDGTANSVVPFPAHLRVPLQIPPMTVKKYAAGKGNAKKQEMLMQIYKRYGVEFNDDNAADSYAIARMAAGLHIDAVESAIIEQIKDLKFRDAIPQ
jgi:Holliday junction resolvasome RuvABC endonuclease subunit